MNEASHTDLVVLGGGPGGYVTAIRSAQLGLRTVLIEELHLGGVCLNEGCVPSKALIHDARALANQAGFEDDSPVQRFAQSFDARQPTMKKLRAGVGSLLARNQVRRVDGTGTFVDRGLIETTGPDGAETIHFGAAVIATGSNPIVPSDLQYDGEFVVTAREVLALRELPSKVVIIGGGYIGLELATALVRFGVHVTVIEATDRLLPVVDEALASHLQRTIVADGIDVRPSTTATGAADGIVHIHDATGPGEVRTDLVVVAVGRRPRTSNIGLDALGLDTTDSGHLEVDSSLRTSVGGIFAVGDVTPGPALAHRAMAQGKVAAEVAAGQAAVFDPAGIPAVVFTTPEIATVGLTLAEATDKGIDASQARFPLAATARGLSLGTDGFGLLVFDQETEFVLGVHLIGPGVGELIGIGALALEMGSRVDDLAALILPHPTMSELYGELGDIASGHPIHVPPPKA